ncbi:hypothetical protein D1115_19770 [Vibrio alfacsensis]|uniref:Uncharacterized protein n=1 Tax=Vibrio alfacsensis TaxID=1074311 RepID=A0ABM6YZ08_9VIBR|nr:hypothetical protein D1115_19770 [Vibrio alfacsensis]
MSNYIALYNEDVLNQYLDSISASKTSLNRSKLRLLANELKIELCVGALKAHEFYGYITKPENRKRFTCLNKI